VSNSFLWFLREMTISAIAALAVYGAIILSYRWWPLAIIFAAAAIAALIHTIRRARRRRRVQAELEVLKARMREQIAEIRRARHDREGQEQ